MWGIAILVGILAAGFAAWYRRFLRSSQERAKANRQSREQEQARKAKEQARGPTRRPRAARLVATPQGRRSPAGPSARRSAQPAHPRVTQLPYAVGPCGPTDTTAEVASGGDPPRHQVDDARLPLERALDVQERVAADDAPEPLPGLAARASR